MILNPKYSLDGASVEGSAQTIPAGPYQAITSRRYPYPRTGTGAPDGMFPTEEPSVYGRYTTKVAVGRPTDLRPKYQSPGYVQAPAIGNPTGLKPHYTMDKAQVEGVMPASTYRALTGKLTTAPELPEIIMENGATVEIEYPTSLMLKQPSNYPAQPRTVQVPALAWDWGSFVAGGILGGITFAMIAYGVVPALVEVGARRIRGI